MTPEVSSIVDNPQRLAALRRAALLDAPAEAAFDRLTRLASRLLGAPVALVSLIDRDRQFFMSCVGLPEPWSSARQTPLSHSFCQHAVESGEALVIEDARLHPLVRDNLAIRDLGVIAYAGIPLMTPDHYALGSFCVIDHQPRHWTDDEIATLRELAASVLTEIELRVVAREAEERAEQAERERSQKVAVLESMTDAFFAVDGEWRCTSLNTAAERLTGYPRALLLGQQLWEIMPELRTSETAERLRQALLDQSPLELETIDPTRQLWREVRAFPSSGGLAIYIRDISARKRAENNNARLNRDLTQRVVELETLFNVVPIGIAIAEDPECRYIRVSPTLAHVLRIDPGDNASHHVPPRKQPAYRVLRDGRALDARELPLERAAATLTHVVDDELDIVHADGTTIKLLGFAAPLLDDAGNCRGSIGAFVDITGRKRAELELFRREQAFMALAEHSPDIIARFDRELKHVYVNAAVERVTGVPASAYIDGSAKGLDFLHDARRAWEAALRAVFETTAEQSLEFSE